MHLVHWGLVAAFAIAWLTADAWADDDGDRPGHEVAGPLKEVHEALANLLLAALHVGGVVLVRVTVLARGGSALSVFPAVRRLSAAQTVAGHCVADLAARVAAHHPGLEEIRRSPSGTRTA